MSLRGTSEMLARSEHIERDLHAARTGARKTYRAHSKLIDGCAECGDALAAHVRESGIPFCSEAALRERYGR